MDRPPEKLPDPWLFDSESLLRELDRCRELVLAIPSLTHESHFATNLAVNAIWNLSQTLRFLLHLHKEGQRSFAKQQIQADERSEKRHQKHLAAKAKIIRLKA
jgi:hypothetical protein